VKLLEKWNKKINLIGLGTIDNVWQRHILDSVQLINYIDKDSSVTDVGSGAGLPGIILSYLGVRDVKLIESDERKCAFLLQASMLSEHKVEIINERVEKIALESDIITARAFSDIYTFCDLIANFRIHDKVLLLKGKNVDEEIEKAMEFYSFELSKKPSITSLDSSILEIKNIRPR
jgi:16S rRNA (guanine527-N7)-methyltransferase